MSAHRTFDWPLDSQEPTVEFHSSEMKQDWLVSDQPSCVVMHCRVLSCVVMCCHVLSCVVVCCHVLSCVVMCCRVEEVDT